MKLALALCLALVASLAGPAGADYAKFAECLEDKGCGMPADDAPDSDVYNACVEGWALAPSFASSYRRRLARLTL